MSYRFDWSDWVTPALLDELRALAGVDAARPLDALVPLIAAALAAAGGLPVWHGDPPADAARTDTARRLLHQALRHAAIGQWRRPAPRGLVFEPSREAMLAQRARALPLVEVNQADAAPLDALPGIGPLLARRIVDERHAHGPYASAQDLAQRVDGLGLQRLHRLRSVLSYAHPRRLRWAPRAGGEWADDLRALLVMSPGRDGDERLHGLLERAATVCAGSPSPDTRGLRPLRTAVAPPPPRAAQRAPWVSVLAGADYVDRLPELFGAATTRIELLMFHIALASAAHPTRRLLDALIAAGARGVAVRVLVDQDQPDDPYHSTVINSAAARALRDGGVAVRVDSRERLLHSKALSIDDALLVMGSHNWSAGSYFGFDDLSLALRAPALALQFRQRFDALWALGEVLPP
ncbi:MAG: phospholipase D-like domain-containing protein [Rubrivivax sp.]